jgi:DNA polymerase-3 subunit delta
MVAARRGAAAAPNEVLRQVRGQLRKGWPPGLTVLCGDDLYHMDEAQRSLLAVLLPEEAPDLALTVYGGDEKLDVRTAVGAARSLGMFAERRVVLVRDAATLEGPAEALGEFAADPPGQGYLIVRAAKLDRRRKLHSVLAKAGSFLPFDIPERHRLGCLTGEVRSMAKDRGLTLDPQSTEFLLTAHEGDLYRVAAELDKILAWLGDSGGKVTLETVRRIDPAGGALVVWDLTGAVLARDRKRALALMRRLVESGQPPPAIVGALGWQARLMLRAKAMLDDGAAFAEVLRVVHGAARQKNELAEGLRRYSREELLAFPAALLAADRTLKSRGIAPLAVLEQLVDRLTAAGPA